jgi:hypothetical protein
MLGHAFCIAPCHVFSHLYHRVYKFGLLAYLSLFIQTLHTLWLSVAPMFKPLCNIVLLSILQTFSFLLCVYLSIPFISLFSYFVYKMKACWVDRTYPYIRFQSTKLPKGFWENLVKRVYSISYRESLIFVNTAPYNSCFTQNSHFTCLLNNGPGSVSVSVCDASLCSTTRFLF